MRTTVDPNQLAPLTELANRALQEQIRGIPEFDTSSRWAASAIVLQMNEGPQGYELRIGFELRTPLNESIDETITDMASLKEIAVRHIVGEWVAHCLRPVVVIQASASVGTRGETAVEEKGRSYPWRLVEGPLGVVTDDKIAAYQIQRDLKERSLFQRFDFGSMLPMQRDLPLLCLKLQIKRAAAAEDPAQRTTYECKINHEDWPKGLQILSQFRLPPTPSGLRVVQYLIFRREGPAKAMTSAPAGHAASAPGKTRAASTKSAGRPWWKFW